MPDSLTPERRSWNMSRIKNKDTSIEIRVRKWLFANGFRFRKNFKGLPGHPDIVMKKYKTAIFIHGCFWHRHENCKDATTPKTRTEFWVGKFDKNVENDRKAYLWLDELGWNTIVLWQCQLEKDFEETMKNIKSVLTQIQIED
jgi:DNA mismatch endonuclease (patch repair protein)